MAIIGHFTAAKDGGWEGSIQTLSINAKLRIVPNDNQAGDKAPAFRIFAGRSEIGAAWKARSQGDSARDYLSVKLDDPLFSEGIQAALFENGENSQATLVWNRKR
jgi:uncharacterized protein (DUF736 family)